MIIQASTIKGVGNDVNVELLSLNQILLRYLAVHILKM